MVKSLANWLEQIDPYYTQRLILRKGLFIASWLTVVNLLARPDVFTAYAMPPIFLAAIYEMPIFDSFKQKELALVIAFVAAGIGCIGFYLLYPFQFTLMFFAVIYVVVLYLLCNRYFHKFRSCIMLTMVVSALNMKMNPSGSLQVVIDVFFCIMLALLVTFFSFKWHPNLYHLVWYRAFKLYVTSIEGEVSHAINKFDTSSFAQGAAHLNIIRTYRRLTPRYLMRNIYAATVAMRSIQFALNHMYQQPKDEKFWFVFQQNLKSFLQALYHKTPTHEICIPPYLTDFTERYVYTNLNKAIRNWNKICWHF